MLFFLCLDETSGEGDCLRISAPTFSKTLEDVLGSFRCIFSLCFPGEARLSKGAVYDAH